MKRIALAGVMTAVVVGWAAVRVTACPFCFGSLQLTLREQVDASDATVIVRWQAGDPGNLNTGIPASTTFEILKVLQGDLVVGGLLTIDRHQEGRPGDVFLMSANVLEDALKWDRSIPLSDEGLAYLRDLPPSAATITDRLRYTLRFLESPDDTVATDAFTVLAGARYEDIVLLKDEFPREKLRGWVFGEDKLKGQLGVYGMLLGLCGDQSDCQPLERMILEIRGADDYRLGIGGVMGGYLMLTGTDGLDVLERTFLANTSASASDRAAVMESLRFMGQYAEVRIGKPRLAQSLRRHLDTLDLPELAISDLARWEDWSATGELIRLYHDPRRSDKHVKKAIIQFMILASQADREGLTDEQNSALDAAGAFVETLQKEEPALYKRAARAVVPMSETPRQFPPVACSKWRC